MREIVCMLLIPLAACSTSVQPPAWSADELGAIRITDRASFPDAQRLAVDKIIAALAQSGEVPSEFYAVVQTRAADQVAVFHLWHSSAFLPENRGVVGNPGGKCRDIEYDLVGQQVSRTLWWQ